MSIQSLTLRVLGLIGTTVLATAPLMARAADDPAQLLSFDVSEGLNLNSFLRSGPVAAHLLLRSGADPRILVAFPAGNSGVGLWFAHRDGPVTWQLLGRPRPLAGSDAQGRALHGMSAVAGVSGASELVIRQAVLSSVRVLRDYQSIGKLPTEVLTDPLVEGTTITWQRDRLDGAAGYRLGIEVTRGTLVDGAIRAGSDGRIELKISALTGEPPLTPLGGTSLLNDRAQADDLATHVLEFLSYREKFLAGSWRFNTYFGRDTLMSVGLLMPALAPDAVEAGLGAVLTRLSARGDVAHEEDIGEFAVLDHLRADGTRSDAPTFNYNMIDADYMLAPVAAAWLLDDARGRARASAFLARQDGRTGEAARQYGVDLVSNLRLAIEGAIPFADHPLPAHLVGLKPGLHAGQWRDSDEGLGRGRYPYDVNAVFVPATLEAAQRFYANGLLDPYLRADERALFARAGAMAAVWRRRAAPLFSVQVPNAEARDHIRAYARTVDVPPIAALAAIGSAPLRFHALSLGTDGAAVPVMHSDEGFALLFGRPRAADLDQAITALMRPFPAGLLTDVGVVVANPVFAGTGAWERFSRNAYHGAVIWSWQQAVLAAGMARQLQRSDLPAPVRLRLRNAQRRLWQAIDAGRIVRNSELWSWVWRDGGYQVAPFGASGADADESNAAQLWSTVYLAIATPGSITSR